MDNTAGSTRIFCAPKTCEKKPSNTFIHSIGMNLANHTSDEIIDILLSASRMRAFFMNAHCCNIHRRNSAYAQAVSGADILLPDGIGIEVAARISGESLKENLNGTDLVPKLLAQAARMGKSVYLFGGTPGTADAAALTLLNTLPDLKIAGTRDGYSGAHDPEAVIDAINESGADIVLVALGVPTQEIWLHQYADRLDAPLTLAVGALFDFLAGSVLRAPAPVRRARMEWIWRLAQEPRRLAARYLIGNPAFISHAIMKSLSRLSFADLLRRTLDLSLSLCALVLLSPLLILTALAIRLDSKGPALFHQTRVGQDGKTFTMFKFRSMSTDAEKKRASLLSHSDREGLCFKSRTDPRITRVGQFIRRFSIDELPQLLNVIRGEMAIVGPRPALPSEVAAYPSRAYGRLTVKPGITGVWQVSGRANIGFEKMVEMDISYASCRTLLVDVVLILKTFGAVFSGRGAY